MFLKEIIIYVFIVSLTKVRSQDSSLNYNYYENITYDDTSDLEWNCEPVCSNGFCSRNNDCICFESFEIYPPGSNTCVPRCDDGYERVNGVCRPYCSKPCAHGICIAPERCSCDFGWTRNVLGECISFCHPECGYGTCVGWNNCRCWAGFERKKNGDPQCSKQEVAQSLTASYKTPTKNMSVENTSTLNSGGFILGAVGASAQGSNISRAATLRKAALSSVPQGGTNLNPALTLNCLYAACASNVVLLIIVTIILVKNPGILKCVKLNKRSINISTIECNEQGYVVMHSHNSGNSRSSNIYSYPYSFTKVIKDKVISEGSSIRASSHYDCVQV